jgi:hypothetical protein
MFQSVCGCALYCGVQKEVHLIPGRSIGQSVDGGVLQAFGSALGIAANVDAESTQETPGLPFIASSCHFARLGPMMNEFGM